MYQFTVPMALADFVPEAFFAVTAVLLLKDLYKKVSAAAFVLLAAGLVNVFAAGFCKALWKLLYAAGVCDFTVLEKMFLPVNSIGLLLAGAAMPAALSRKKGECLLSAAPAAFMGSLPFIAMMVLGMGSLCAGLSVLSARMKKGRLAIWFILAFVLSMAMGYLSGQDPTLARVNWAEQAVNSLSQLCLMLGTVKLHKAGLKTPLREAAL